MTIDIQKEIRRAVDTGNVIFGFRSAQKSILKGKAKLIIIAANCPRRLSLKIRHDTQITQTPLFEFDGTGLQLGSICGKPFLVSTLGITDEGKSKVLEITQTEHKKTPTPKKANKPKRKKTVEKKPSTKKTKKTNKTKKKYKKKS